MSMLKTALAGGALWAGLMFSVSVSAHPKLLSSAPAAGAQGGRAGGD